METSPDLGRLPLATGTVTIIMSGPLICVIEDHHDVAETLKELLEANGFRAQVFGSAEEFLAEFHSYDIACLLADVVLPGMNGLDLLQHLGNDKSNIPVLLMTGYGVIREAVQAMKAGAVDVLEKPFTAKEMLTAIHGALGWPVNGHASAASIDPEPVSPLTRLTGRERQVFDLLMQGDTNKVIAAKLQISPRTVEYYRARIMSKTGSGNLASLIRMGFEAGL